jgi:hypothetical protein
VEAAFGSSSSLFARYYKYVESLASTTRGVDYAYLIGLFDEIATPLQIGKQSRSKSKSKSRSKVRVFSESTPRAKVDSVSYNNIHLLTVFMLLLFVLLVFVEIPLRF